MNEGIQEAVQAEAADTTDRFLPDAASLAKIRAAIALYNAGRPAVERTALIQTVLIMGGFVLAGVAAIILATMFDWQQPRMFVAVILIVGIPTVWRHARRHARQYQETTRARLAPEIFGFIDDFSLTRDVDPGFYGLVDNAQLIGYDKAKTDDCLSGRYEGLRFQLAEVELIVKGGKTDRTVFEGILFRFDLEPGFPGALYARQKAGLFERAWRDMFGSSMTAITPKSGALAEAYEFSTDNPSAAQALIDGPLEQALAYVRDEWREGQVQLAFVGRDGLIILPTRINRFELPPISQDIDFSSHVKPLIHELMILLEIARLIHKVPQAAKAG